MEAADGEAALELVTKQRPDLILMDISLPKIDGFEVTRRLKEQESFKAVPIIALTAHAMQGDEKRARECGCSDYLSKPIDEDLLFQKINHHIGVGS